MVDGINGEISGECNKEIVCLIRKETIVFLFFVLILQKPATLEQASKNPQCKKSDSYNPLSNTALWINSVIHWIQFRTKTLTHLFQDGCERCDGPNVTVSIHITSFTKNYKKYGVSYIYDFIHKKLTKNINYLIYETSCEKSHMYENEMVFRSVFHM